MAVVLGPGVVVLVRAGAVVGVAPAQDRTALQGAATAVRTGMVRHTITTNSSSSNNTTDRHTWRR